MYGEIPFSAVITGVGSYVPDKILTNADLEKMVDTSDEWIVTRTGIRERHILDDDKATSDMAVSAATNALADAGISSEDVDIVICATFTSDYIFPSTACVMQDKMNLKNAACFDLAAACSGFIYGITVGGHFASCGMAKRILVIGADANSRLVDWTDRNTCVIFGDGAAAVVLESRKKPSEAKDYRGILSSFLKSDGTGWQYLFQPAGGSSRPPTHETVDERLHHIKMAGKETFKFASRAMTQAAREAISRANLTIEDIDIVVPHQANIRIINNSMRRLGIPDERIIINIDKYGNTVAASVGIALDEAYRGGRLEDGSNVLLVGFGAGLTWGGVVLRWGR